MVASGVTLPCSTLSSHPGPIDGLEEIRRIDRGGPSGLITVPAQNASRITPVGQWEIGI